ncbi:MAG: phosphoglycerate kinase, partial [Candidatus Dadabacteria bacterium]|nr:phosphoglycerate kinase [Candidatus Dadabacteria bacterium]
GMAKHFSKRLAGFVVDREIKFLHQLIDSPKRPYLVIVGGSKIKDKIQALKNLIEKADEVIIGGGVAYTFLKAKGVNVGNSVTED